MDINQLIPNNLEASKLIVANDTAIKQEYGY